MTSRRQRVVKVGETVAAIVEAHRSGASSPEATVARTYARIRAHGDPAIFITLRDEADALAEAADAGGQGRYRSPALWRAGRGQGQYRRRGIADHRRLPGLRVRRRQGRDLRREAQAGRRHRHRQDQSRPVRHRPGRRALALRHAAQPVRSRAHSRRVELRFGDRGRGRPRSARARHRYRRVRPRAGRAEQHRRPQAEPRPRLHRRRRAGLPHARLRVGVRAHGRRRLRGAGGHGRPRSGRSLFAAAPARRAGSGAGGAAHRRADAGPAPVLRRQGVGRRLRGRARRPGGPRRRHRRDRHRAVLRNRAPPLRRTVGGGALHQRALADRVGAGSDASR